MAWHGKSLAGRPKCSGVLWCSIFWDLQGIVAPSVLHSLCTAKTTFDESIQQVPFNEDFIEAHENSHKLIRKTVVRLLDQAGL